MILLDVEGFNADGAGTQVSIVLIGIIITGIVVSIVRYFKNLKLKVDEFIETQDIQSEAIRNIIKSLIVDKDEEARDKGYMANTKLETTERLNDSYEKLKGNSYIDDVMKRLRKVKPKNRRYNGIEKRNYELEE